VTADATVDEAALRDALAASLRRPLADPVDGSTVPGDVAAAIAARAGIDVEALALLALPLAAELADPSISGYRVAAVGIEAETGALLLGGNLEFPGAELGATIHAEGFVALRARRRGRRLATLACRIARPCAHCRQVLTEAADAADLVLIDTQGRRLSLADLYPFPFGPDALGNPGDPAGRDVRGDPTLAGVTPEPTVANALLAAGRRAHAPYSGAPSAAVLRARDGTIVSAGCLESVAFNPSIGALPAALVELAAARIDRGEVVDAWLGCSVGGQVDPEPGFRALLAAVAPTATAHVVRWRTTPGTPPEPAR
jgi:cytidine deaminase